MTGETEKPHLTIEDLVDYFDKGVSADLEERIEIHIARCDDCAERARRAHALCGTWANWNAKSHRQALRRAMVEKSLAEAGSQSQEHIPEWKRRLERWREVSAGLAEGVVEIVMSPARDATRIITEGMEALIRPGAGWRFSPQAAYPVVRGVGGERRPCKIAVAENPEGMRASVKIEEPPRAGREIVVYMDRPPRARDLPIVLLISTVGDPGREIRIRQMEPQAVGLLARFEDVPDGDYILAIEPLA